MNMKLVAKILGKVGLYGFIAFVGTFGLYMFNGAWQVGVILVVGVLRVSRDRYPCKQ